MNTEKAIKHIDACKKTFAMLNDRWERFGYKQAEILFNEFNRPVLFKSYDTIVGVISDDKFYELGKYSTTTSKQVTQFCNAYGLDRELLDRPEDSWSNTWKSVTY